MFSMLLISVVIAPVLLGMVAARGRRSQDALVRLIVLLGAYDLFYIVLLHYLRYRWLG